MIDRTEATVPLSSPLEKIGEVLTPDGSELALWRHDDFFQMRLNGLELMSSHAHGSEEALAERAHEALGGMRAPRILIGGLGMGFTLRAALDCFDQQAHFEVAEIFPEVVRWNRTQLASLASRPLEDPRVSVVIADVLDVLEPSGFDAILLDVDNGPTAFTLASNSRIYNDSGIERLATSLRPGGVLAVWAADPDPAFERRLTRAGLETSCHEAPVCGRHGGPLRTHYLAKRLGRSQREEAAQTPPLSTR